MTGKFIVKRFVIRIDGYCDHIELASTKSRAVYRAYKAFNEMYRCGFMEFVQRTYVFREAQKPSYDFGRAIKISGKPAFLIEGGHRCKFVYPDSDVVLQAHYSDVAGVGEEIAA